MGKGSQGTQNGVGKSRPISMEEVKDHDKYNDKWLVIQGEVYNITEWSKRHPGGSRVISHFAGQDASDAFRAFHNNMSYVKKFLKPIHMGSLQETECKELAMDRDFRELRATVEKMGLFKSDYFFFAWNLAHVILLEYMAYAVMAYFGTGWIPYLLSLCFYTIVQAQTGWIQHDLGHVSVFKNRFNMDHILHLLSMGIIKGASPNWWNHMHYQHHAKPNVINKDPDVRVEALFVVGDVMPVKMAKKTNTMPYNWQHRYFFLLGPPLLFPVYFQYTIFRHIFTRKLWIDLFMVMLFFIKYVYLYMPLLGFWGIIVYYFTLRCLESHWFTWVAQSNHIPMEINEDTASPWLKLQLDATCNVEQSLFNDWFTGHLNMQVEHHLFPTMPRHNLHKTTPLIKSLCKKHGLKFQEKPLGTAFADVVRSLKQSGELWSTTYNALHKS